MPPTLTRQLATPTLPLPDRTSPARRGRSNGLHSRTCPIV
jgi:hypothetical protein